MTFEKIDHSSLHRAAKYFMDSGQAETVEAAMGLLQGFGLTIYAGQEIAHSADHQTALLTLVNTARRTLLGGIEVVGLPEANCITSLAPNQALQAAVHELGGRSVDKPRTGWPVAVIGTADVAADGMPCWRVTWDGWRGGVIPARDGMRLSDANGFGIAPALAAGICAAEAFAFHAGDTPMAGRRATGLSLWAPGRGWLVPDLTEPAIAYLPSRLWFIGLGNLGQAFAWVLACLPFRDPGQVQLVLQDFDRIAESNDSTSLLSRLSDIDHRKTRVVAEWLEARGFETFLEERQFGPWTQRMGDEPGVALCGIDNPNGRAALEKAGFGLIVEAGLGAGPQEFRSLSMHCFPGSRSAESIWSKLIGRQAESVENMPAYQALKKKGMDGCGLAQLASRTVGVPFVGLIAACLAVSELLRRLNGGTPAEVISTSAAALDTVEMVTMQASPYAFGHLATCDRQTTSFVDVAEQSI